MPKTTVATASSSNFNDIFEKALRAYSKKTKQDLTAHPLATQLNACDSPAAIVAILQDKVDEFRQSQSGDEGLRKWLDPTINVLYAFSATLGTGVGMVNINLSMGDLAQTSIRQVFSPAQVIFAGAGVLLSVSAFEIYSGSCGSRDIEDSQAAKDVKASQDVLIDTFERIENFFRRLEIYTNVPPTPAMTDMMVKIMVEVLGILGTATKELKQSRMSEVILRLGCLRLMRFRKISEKGDRHNEARR